MSFKFEKLIIWQKSMDFGEKIFLISKDFPKEEMFNLISQIRRAVDSIALIFQKVQSYNQRWSLRDF